MTLIISSLLRYILTGKDTELLLEQFGEILRRIETHLHRELSHTDIWLLTHDTAGLLQTDGVDEACDILPCQRP